jgi:hypothetical protein
LKILKGNEKQFCCKDFKGEKISSVNGIYNKHRMVRTMREAISYPNSEVSSAVSQWRGPSGSGCSVYGALSVFATTKASYKA